MRSTNKNNQKLKVQENENKISGLGTNENSGQSIKKLKQQQDVEFCHQQVCLFMKRLKKDYKRLSLFYNSCINAEYEKERKNKEEILQLTKVCHEMQNDIISIKRRNWCRYCESEATYLSLVGKKFYCSQECERKQIEFVNIIQ